MRVYVCRCVDMFVCWVDYVLINIFISHIFNMYMILYIHMHMYVSMQYYIMKFINNGNNNKVVQIFLSN